MIENEKKVIEVIIDELQNKLLYHNKNLTKKQLYCVEDVVEILKILKDENGINDLIEIAKTYHGEKK